MDCRVWQYSREAVAFGAALAAVPAKTKPAPAKSEIVVAPSKPAKNPQPQCCKAYVRPASIGRIIGAAVVNDPLDTEEKAGAFINAHTMPCFLDLVVENTTSKPLRSPRLTLTNKESAPNPYFLQMEDIPAHESGSYNSYNLNWVITPGDEIHVEFANMPGVRVSVQVTVKDIAATWAENEKAPQPVPVFVTWRRGFWKGAVLSIVNMTDRKLRGLTISTSAGDATTKHDIDASGTLEIGSSELTGDRNFQGGDIFAIEASGFLQVAGFVMDEDGSSQGESGWWKVAKIAATIGLGAAGISLGG